MKTRILYWSVSVIVEAPDDATDDDIEGCVSIKNVEIESDNLTLICHDPEIDYVEMIEATQG